MLRGSSTFLLLQYVTVAIIFFTLMSFLTFTIFHPCPVLLLQFIVLRGGVSVKT